MKCPWCEAPMNRDKPNHDYPMFVSTDYNGDDAVYEPLVQQFSCEKNQKHYIFIVPDKVNLT